MLLIWPHGLYQFEFSGCGGSGGGGDDAGSDEDGDDTIKWVVLNDIS